MKLAVYCITGLCKEALARLRLAVLDDMKYTELVGIVPATPVTAWTSAWTGVDPAVHGKFPGTRGQKPELETVWSLAENQGLKICLHEEGKWAEEQEGDIHIYRLDSLPALITSGDLAEAQERINDMAGVIEKNNSPFLILSALAVKKPRISMNVDRFLIGRRLLQLDKRDRIAYEKSAAYPANYTGKKPRLTYGIYLNHNDRQEGILEFTRAINMEASLLGQLNAGTNIEAKPAHLEYDIGGKYYDDLPDIVFRTDGAICFRSTGMTDHKVVSPYTNPELAPIGFVAASDSSWLENIHVVTDIRSMVLRALKEVA